MPRKTNNQKVSSSVRRSVEKFSGDIESLSSQIANLTDAIISEKNLAASKIKSERELLARKTALQNIKEDIDDLRSERRKNQDKLDRLISEQQKEAEKEKEENRKKETQYSDSAKKSFESGQFISGMIFKFLGRNEKDKKQIEAERKADRQDQIQELRNRSKELNEQTKSLKDIRNNINVLNTNIVNAEEERIYEQRDAEKTASDIVKFLGVKIIDIEDLVLTKLEKTIKKSIKESNISGSGLSSLFPNIPIPKLPSSTRTVSKLGRIGKVAGKIALPLAIASGMYDFATGLSDEATRKILGKKTGENISYTDRFRSGASNLKSGLTFGLIPPEFFAKTDVLDPLLGPYSPIGLLTNWFIDGELLNSLKTLTNTIGNWFTFGNKPKSPDTAPESSSAIASTALAPPTGVPKAPIEKLQKEMDPALIAAIEKQFAGDPNTIESVKRLAFSESRGRNIKSGLTGTDYGYFQFNRAYAIANAKKAGFNIKQPEDIMKLSAEDQTKIYAEYIKNLSQAQIPLTPENLKIYGFASGTGLEALKAQAAKGEEVAGKSIIYSKKWLDEKIQTPEGKRNFAHFIEMSRLDPESGGAVTLRGMQNWIRSQKSELSTQQMSKNQSKEMSDWLKTVKQTKTSPQQIRNKDNSKDDVGRNVLRFKDIDMKTNFSDSKLKEKYPTLYDEMLKEKNIEMNKPEKERQSIKGSGTTIISPEARMRLRAIYEQTTGKSSSVEGLSYNDLQKGINEIKTSQISSNITNGSQLYSSAMNNKTMQQQTQGNNVVVSSNNVVNNQTAKSSPRKELKSTIHPIDDKIHSNTRSRG